MPESEPAKRAKVPIRTCVICKKRFPKKELLRMVRCISPSPDDPDRQDYTLVADLTQTKNGRGWYLCNDVKCKSKINMFSVRQKKGRG